MLFLIHAVILCRRHHYPQVQGRKLRLREANYPTVVQLSFPCSKSVLLTIISYLQLGDCKSFSAWGDIVRGLLKIEDSGSSVKSVSERNEPGVKRSGR